ncbi:hypothetical protein ISCGN_022211 [Ixodes scapularis]
MASDEELAPWLCTLVPAPAKLLGLHRLVSCMHLDLENLFFKDVNAGFGLPCLRTHSAGVAEVCPPFCPGARRASPWEALARPAVVPLPHSTAAEGEKSGAQECSRAASGCGRPPLLLPSPPPPFATRLLRHDPLGALTGPPWGHN